MANILNKNYKISYIANLNRKLVIRFG